MDVYSECFVCGRPAAPDGKQLCHLHRPLHRQEETEMLAPPTDEDLATENQTTVSTPFDEFDHTDVAAYAARVTAAVDIGTTTYTVFTTASEGREGEFCRHSVIADSTYEAALAAVKECRLTTYGPTMIAEVFAHTGFEHRFSYQLVAHNNEGTR